MKLICVLAVHLIEPLYKWGGKPFQHDSDSPICCCELSQCMLVDGGRSLLVITKNGYPASLALAPGHCLGTRLPKERCLAVTSVCHTKGKTDLPRLVLKVHRWCQEVPYFTQKQSVHHCVSTLQFDNEQPPQRDLLGEHGPLFPCANPLALKMPLLR